MSDNNTEEVKKLLTETIDTEDDVNKDVPLESLVMLVSMQRIDSLQATTQKELEELKTRQDLVALAHKVLKTVNAQASESGEIDVAKIDETLKALKAGFENDEELKKNEMRYKAFVDQVDEIQKQLGSISKGKAKLPKESRERFVDNIRMTIEDLNVKNEMQLQAVSRLTTERYEMYQMLRSIMKPLHEDKLQKARALSGK